MRDDRPDLSLTELADRPELVVTIAGKSYAFSELPIGPRADLQAWINANVPHPIDALKGHLDGLTESDRRVLLEAARLEARSWPPELGTEAGARALLGTERGQVETIYRGLLVHQPATTRDDAHRVFRALGREAAADARKARAAGRNYDGEGTVRRIYAVMFGMADEDEDDGLPKG